MTINWTATAEEYALVAQIAEKAKKLFAANGVKRRQSDIEMDLLATHLNGCPLDLEYLLIFDDFNLAHDIGGIANHLDRTTGQLGGCFLPRCSMPDADTPEAVKELARKRREAWIARQAEKAS